MYFHTFLPLDMFFCDVSFQDVPPSHFSVGLSVSSFRGSCVFCIFQISVYRWTFVLWGFWLRSVWAVFAGCELRRAGFPLPRVGSAFADARGLGSRRTDLVASWHVGS